VTSAYGLVSIVIWTLTLTSTGIHLGMGQSGFLIIRPEYSARRRANVLPANTRESTAIDYFRRGSASLPSCFPDQTR
jgi:hypothetical protein